MKQKKTKEELLREYNLLKEEVQNEEDKLELQKKIKLLKGKEWQLKHRGFMGIGRVLHRTGKGIGNLMKTTGKKLNEISEKEKARKEKLIPNKNKRNFSFIEDIP